MSGLSCPLNFITIILTPMGQINFKCSMWLYINRAYIVSDIRCYPNQLPVPIGIYLAGLSYILFILFQVSNLLLAN